MVGQTVKAQWVRQVGVMAVGLALMVAGVGGCASRQAPDCIVKVLYRGSVYRSVQTVSIPRTQRSLGEATFGNCRGQPLTGGSYRGRLRAIPDVDPDLAVLLHGDGFRSFYVKQELPMRKWPQVLQEADRYPRCQHPVRFTGTWSYADTALTRQDVDGHAVPPYRASFKARRGHGLDFQRWAYIGLSVQVTEHTDPLPEPRAVKRALNTDAPVTVRAVCDGKKFEAASVRLTHQPDSSARPHRQSQGGHSGIGEWDDGTTPGRWRAPGFRRARS